MLEPGRDPVPAGNMPSNLEQGPTKWKLKHFWSGCWNWIHLELGLLLEPATGSDKVVLEPVPS